MSKVEIEMEELKQLFDLIVGSLDFGSGFLDNDDVVLLRKLATVLGVNPMVATPYTDRKTYPHAFEPYDDPRSNSYCHFCGLLVDHHLHTKDSRP